MQARTFSFRDNLGFLGVTRVLKALTRPDSDILNSCLALSEGCCLTSCEIFVYQNFLNTYRLFAMLFPPLFREASAWIMLP